MASTSSDVNLFERLARQISAASSFHAFEEGSHPRNAWATAGIMCAAVICVVSVPQIQPYFELRHPELIITTAILGAMVTTVSWMLRKRGDEVWPYLLEMVDTTLYALVPILVALWSQPIGAGIGLALHGLMLMHWARLAGRNRVYMVIVLLPPLVLIPKFVQIPWLALECGLSLSIYFLVATIEDVSRQREDEQRRRETMAIVADAVRGAYKEAELATILEARLQLHEIRDALNPARLCVEILEDDLEALSDEGREAFESVKKGVSLSSERLKTLMSRLRPPGRGDVSDLDEVLDVMNSLIGQDPGRIKPSVVGETEGILVRGKTNVLAGCLVNLVRNAREAGATKVAFNIFAQDEHVVVRIEDNGKGVPPELGDKIFLSGVTSGKPHGSGQALHIISTILKTLGGEIRLARSSDLRGAAFELKLSRPSERDLRLGTSSQSKARRSAEGSERSMIE